MRPSTLAIIAAAGDAPSGNGLVTAWPDGVGDLLRSLNRPSGFWLGSLPVKQKTAPGLAAG